MGIDDSSRGACTRTGRVEDWQLTSGESVVLLSGEQRLLRVKLEGYAVGRLE